MTDAANTSASSAGAKSFTPFDFLPNHDKTASQETDLVILPDPVGYHMLIALPTMAQQTAKGIYIPDIVNERERAATVMGTVLAMGAGCYQDLRRFGVDVSTSGPLADGTWGPIMKRVLQAPWCKVGDTVLFSRYSGMRFRSKDVESGDMVEYRMLSDDNVVGVVPEGAQVAGL